MDSNDILNTAGVSTSGIAIIFVIYKLIKTMKGKRFVSSCCGKRMDVGIDVENMTPKTVLLPITSRGIARSVDHDDV